MSAFIDEVKAVLEAIENSANSHGIGLGQAVLDAARETLLWIHYFRTNHSLLCAEELIDGAHASVLEAVTYTSLGFARAAISSIRTQIDLLLGFSYFCDHPREWRRVLDTGDGFILKKDLQTYHSNMEPSLDMRMGILSNTGAPLLNEAYRILSAHIHAQSSYTMPRAKKIADLIETPPVLESVVRLQSFASDALSTYFVAVYASRWTALPQDPVSRVRSLLTADQESKFFGMTPARK